jgi:hypothetical protein
MASSRSWVGRANTKRHVRGTMNFDRPSLPMRARPVPKFTSAKIVGSPLCVATGSIAMLRERRRAADRDSPTATSVRPQQGTAQDQLALLVYTRLKEQQIPIPRRAPRPKEGRAPRLFSPLYKERRAGRGFRRQKRAVTPPVLLAARAHGPHRRRSYPPHPARSSALRPRNRRTAESGYQFPPSDSDCHTPLPCEVRKADNTTPPACRKQATNNVRTGACRTEGGDDLGVAVTAHFLSRP